MVKRFALSVPDDATIGDVLATCRISDEGLEIAARLLPQRTLGELQGLRMYTRMVIDVGPALPRTARVIRLTASQDQAR